MSPNKPLMIARVARAAAASAVFATFAAAHAQMIEPARIVAPALTLAAAPAAMPAATPAVAAVPRPVTPAALPQASTPNAAPPATCSAPTEFSHFDRPLVRTARRLASGEPLTIVAIGSSSTAGAGASSPDASYPSRLAVELKQRFPLQDITVLNRGVNGEETEDMMARFASRRHRRASATRALAGRHQFGAARSSAGAAFGAAARRHRRAQGDRRRRGADRSAICAEGSGEVRDAGHGRADRRGGEGRERRPVPALRGDAQLVRSAAPAVRHVRVAGRAAYERLGLCLRGKAPRHRHRRSGDPPGARPRTRADCHAPRKRGTQ